MGCGGSKAKAAPAAAPGLLGKEGAVTTKAGNVIVHGVPASMNSLGPILLATASGCGNMQKCMPFQDTNTEAFLKINPFHAVPALQDGDFCLAECNAVLRYVAETYAKDAYPTDPKLRGFIDWAMDRFSGANYSDAVATIYPLFGYAEAPADLAAAGKKCTDNLKEFAEVFLKKGKFVGGEKPSIADYKFAPFFFCYEHAALKEKSFVDCPDRIKQFNKDFATACGNAAGILTSAGGFALKEILDAKQGLTQEAAPAPAPSAPPAEETKPADAPPTATPAANDDAAKAAKGDCVIYGVPPSMNCLGAILLVTVGGCGRMEKCMPFQDTNTEEFLKMNPFHAVPTLKDGDYCLAESSAILRYVSQYVPDAYPEDPKVRGFINWAMDRFSSANAPDAVATIYPLLGFAEPPADLAAAGKKCTDNLKEFAEVFLKKGKFVGGEKPSIADYKIAPFLFCYEHAALKEKSFVDCPDRIKQFNKDFAAACGDAAGIMSSAGGFALKEMLDAKLVAAAPEPATEAAKEEPVKEEPVKEEQKPVVVPEEEAPVTATPETLPVEVAVPKTQNCCF